MGDQVMRGTDHDQSTMFSYVSPEARVPADHPLRATREMTNQALAFFDAVLEQARAAGLLSDEHYLSLTRGCRYETWTEEWASLRQSPADQCV